MGEEYLDNDFFENSVYYPACEFDGTPIKFLSWKFSNFVYSDYLHEYSSLEESINIHGLMGYRLEKSRAIDAEELFGMSWEHYLDINKSIGKLLPFEWKDPFAMFYVFRRLEHLTGEHGKPEIRLLYIRSEGISAFKHLYIRRNIAPKCLVSINPGLGFGGGFGGYYGILSETILASKALPQYIFYDGNGMNYISQWYKTVIKYECDRVYCGTSFRFAELDEGKILREDDALTFPLEFCGTNHEE
jgi:hypothetical protein